MKDKIKRKTEIKIILIIILQVFLITNFISAEGGCCPETKEGAICQPMDLEDDRCSENIFPTECDELAGCRYGCCMDLIEGICTENSPENKCNNDEGDWDSQEDCGISYCRKGCCILGTQTKLTTNTECGKLSSSYGIEKIWDSQIQDTISCALKGDSQAIGACVTYEGGCSIGTREECEDKGEFHKNYLCSNPELNETYGVQCKKQDSIGCMEKKIYWFDSCDNRENIYDSNREKSWNNGKILNKSDSCGYGENNINSEDCGNCNYPLGSICSPSSKAGGEKVKDGDFICRDLNCYDTFDGSDRKQGESWCVYESAIGKGRDAVGSNHWIHKCINGEELVNSCDLNRNKICAESTTDLGDGEEMSFAVCAINEWSKCFEINKEYSGIGESSKLKEECNKNNHCFAKEIWNPKEGSEFPDVMQFYPVWACLPQYPPGFEFYNKEANNPCGAATIKTKGMKLKDCNFGLVIDTKWSWVINKIVTQKKWTESMNQMCTSFGDCGAYINYKGDLTKSGYGVTGDAQSVSDKYLNSLKKFSTPIPDLKASFSGEVPDSIPSPSEDNGWLVVASAVTDWDRDALKWINPTLILLYKYDLGSIIVTEWFASEVLGCGNRKEYPAEFKCGRWEAPEGGEDCDLCNEDSKNFPCSEYRCKSLGSACEFIDVETSYSKCVWDHPDDIVPPIITPWQEILSENYTFDNLEQCPPQSGCSHEIKRNSGSECLEPFTPISIGIKTDKLGKCRMGFENEAYENLTTSLGELHSKEHATIVSSPGLVHLEKEKERLSGILLNASPDDFDDYYEILDIINRPIDEKMRLYIKCKNRNGFASTIPMVIEMCLDPEPDIMAPHIRLIIPADGSKTKYNATEQKIKMYVNEPAECKYSNTSQDYETMENSFACETAIADETIDGFLCITTLPLSQNETTIYIKCKDQPLFPENERNTNSGDSYTLYETKEQLNIDSIIMTDTHGNTIVSGEVIETNSDKTFVEINVKTSNGEDNGISECSWSLSGFDNMRDFLYLGSSNTHEQILSFMPEGTHEIYIECIDKVGNKAQDKSVFTIELDDTPPQVVRIYKAGGKLEIITDEEGKCYYDSGKCIFNIENAQTMTTGLSIKHTVNWVVGQTYYIKCTDYWDNINPGCGIIITPDYFG